MPQIISPIDGTVAGEFEQLSMDAALATVQAAEEASAAWRRVPLADRIAVCRKVLDVFDADVGDLALSITRMMGKPVGQARGEIVGGQRERTEWLCDAAPRALADVQLPPKPNFRRFIRREPVGVVLDIAAWNYPVIIVTNVVMPAVLAGDAVLIKHAEQTALVADWFESAFKAAGAPAGLVASLHVDHATAKRLIGTQRFGYVSFTGSVRGGREVYANVATRSLIPVGMELGGKDPAIVFADADFDQTVDNIADGCFYNAGQSCCAVERIYVEEPLLDRFVEAFTAKAHALVVGDPRQAGVAMGPLVNAAAARRVREQIEQAVSGGARMTTDATRFRLPDGDTYVAPTVLIGANPDASIVKDETFGPAIAILPFRDQADAIAQANDSAYGLTASVWTADADRGLTVAEQLEAGTVFQNRCDYLDPALAWTGVKDSGFGCSLSEQSFLSVTRPKSFHLRQAW